MARGIYASISYLALKCYDRRCRGGWCLGATFQGLSESGRGGTIRVYRIRLHTDTEGTD